MSPFVIPCGSADVATIGAFEQRNGLRLPVDYREFLLQTNGGRLHYMACNVKGCCGRVLVETLLGLGHPDQALNAEYWLNVYRDEIPKGVAVIGLGSTGMFILDTEERQGGVHFWDDAHSFAESSEEEGNTYWVAGTFTEFIESLEPLASQPPGTPS